jgi:biopolymer transport protein ExbB
MSRITLVFIGYLLFSSAAWSQSSKESESTSNAQTAVQTAESRATVVDQAPSLEQAYQREFAFLQAQKTQLQERLDVFRARSLSEQRQIRDDIELLEGEVLSVRAQAERLDGLVFDSVQAVETARSNVDVLSSTLLQADITLEDRFSAPESDAIPSSEDFGRLFSAAADAVKHAGATVKRPGRFFDLNGTEVMGEIIEVGRVAAYGIGEEVSGALVPAGGGALKLWDSQPAQVTAQALLMGQRPDTMTLFAFESLVNEVQSNEEKSLFDVIASGGLIGWVIVIMGLGGLGLVVARILFLREASASTETLVSAVALQVSRGDRDGAIETLKQFKGATARVLSTAIRNLDREREHLEDVISESLLNESATLNRFGAVIMVIAAVSPLLGLLGTVTGMISTFDVITEFGTGDPKLLSGGISIALVTTQLGLVVAIPLLLVGNVLSGWAERIKDEMEKSALHIVNRYVEGQRGSVS